MEGLSHDHFQDHQKTGDWTILFLQLLYTINVDFWQFFFFFKDIFLVWPAEFGVLSLRNAEFNVFYTIWVVWTVHFGGFLNERIK